jgi:hypothetical protein
MQPTTALNLPIEKRSFITDFEEFLEALQDKKRQFVVFVRNSKELFYFVRGSKQRPFFLKYHYLKDRKWISEWFVEAEDLGLIMQEVNGKA